MERELSGVVHTDGHLMELVAMDEDLTGYTEILGADRGTPMATLRDWGVLFRIGVSHGPVNVTITVHGAEPTLDPGPWEDVVEGGIPRTGGGLALFGWDAVSGDPVLTEPGEPVVPHREGGYAVRVHARGRARCYDGPTKEPLEDYLVELWPMRTPKPPVVHKHTSGV